jgi:triacylglycerol esterase/lipase EstA (alpha/beta hydrolase family)
MPTARVMVYGYQSRLQGSTSFASLEDLANSLRIAVCRLLRSGREKRLVLIGHSLGGLLIKEALIRTTDSDSESELVSLVSACLFFGVPNDGMDIESLIPMVKDQPNRFLLESLATINSQVSRLQSKNFSRILGQAQFRMFCFYETKLSPTAAKVSISSSQAMPR